MYSAEVAAGATVTVCDRRMLFTDAFDGDMPMPHRNYDAHVSLKPVALADGFVDSIVLISLPARAPR